MVFFVDRVRQLTILICVIQRPSNSSRALFLLLLDLMDRQPHFSVLTYNLVQALAQLRFQSLNIPQQGLLPREEAGRLREFEGLVAHLGGWCSRNGALILLRRGGRPKLGLLLEADIFYFDFRAISLFRGREVGRSAFTLCLHTFPPHLVAALLHLVDGRAWLARDSLRLLP